jgi:hypothetical protein
MPATLSPGVKLFEEPTVSPPSCPMAPPGHAGLGGLEGDHIGEHRRRRVSSQRRRDARVAISITNKDNNYQAAFIRGGSWRCGRGADEIDRLAKKYMGQDRYPWRAPGEQRLIMIIEPERVATMMVD